MGNPFVTFLHNSRWLNTEFLQVAQQNSERIEWMKWAGSAEDTYSWITCAFVCVSLVVAVFSTSIRYLLMFSVLFPMCGLWLSSVKSCLSSCHLKRDIQHVLKRLVVGQNSRKRSTKEQTGSFADCPKPQWWVVCSGVSSSAEEHRRVQALAERKDHESGPHPHRAEKEAGQH